MGGRGFESAFAGNASRVRFGAAPTPKWGRRRMRRRCGMACDREIVRRVLRMEFAMIVLGLILLLIGFRAGISILWTIGIVLIVVGVVLWILGATGHAVAGRERWY